MGTRTKVAGLVLLVAAVAALSAVIATASIPDATSGTITACLNSDHTVRIIDTAVESCEPGETTLGWLNAGGATYEDNTTTAQSLPATVASVTVPAGRYIIQAKTWIDNSGSASLGFSQCGLTGLAGSENSRVSPPAGGYDTATVLGTLDASSSTTVSLFCSGGSPETANFTVLTATSVSSIT